MTTEMLRDVWEDIRIDSRRKNYIGVGVGALCGLPLALLMMCMLAPLALLGWLISKVVK